MSLMIELARKEELKEAIHELLRDRNQRTRFEEVIEKIIVENISNLTGQTKDHEQASDSMVCDDKGKPGHTEQVEQLLQPFMEDERTNLDNFRDSNLETWEPNPLQSPKRIREEMDQSPSFDDLGSEASIEIQESSKMIEGEELRIQTRSETKSMPSWCQEKIITNLTDDNIYIDQSTGFGYQIIYQGRTIDKECLKQITETKAQKTKCGWLLCKIHDDCTFSKPPKIKKSKIQQKGFNEHSERHIRTTLVRNFCRVCLRALSYSTNLVAHLRKHLEPSPLKSLGGPTGEKDFKKITPKIMQPPSDLIDFQGKYRLKLTNRNMHSFSEFNCKYQIYYEGQAIDKDQLKQIMKKKVIKSKSGLFLCPLHEDCSYSREKLSIKSRGLFNQDVLRHTGAAFITYLCRHCFHKSNRLCAMCIHLKLHYNS